MTNPIHDSNILFSKQCPSCNPFQALQAAKDKLFAYPLLERATQNWQALLVGTTTAVAVASFVGAMLANSTLVSGVFFVVSVGATVGTALMLCSYPLVGRASGNWQALIMGGGTAIAITSFAVALFSGATLASGAFFLLSISSAVGTAMMRKYATFDDLQTTATNLKGEVNNLKGEIGQLRTINQQLGQQVNALTAQVSQLQIQLVQLRESAQRIRTEVDRFQHENTLFANNGYQLQHSLQLIEREIQTSRALSAQIAHHLDNQQTGLGVQLQQLGNYIGALGANHSVMDRIRELGVLRDEIQRATDQLFFLRNQFAQERAEFYLISMGLNQLRGEFQQVLTEAAQRFGNNNHELQGIAQRFNQILQQHFPAQTP